ncbi:MAG: PH domain-containing protein [Actinomycetota bacterium]
MSAQPDTDDPVPGRGHAASGAPDRWRRLHPATILSDLVRRLPQVVVGLLLILNSSGGNRVIDTIQLVIGIIAIAPVIVRYVTARYCVDESLLRWREGLFRRHTVDMPRSRIQSIDSRVDLIGRAFGLETVVVSSAGGDSEVSVGLVDRDAAARLRQELQQRAGGDRPADALPPPQLAPRTIAERSGGDLARVVLTATETGDAVAVIVGVWLAVGGLSVLDLLSGAALAGWISLATMATVILAVTTLTGLASRAIGFRCEVQERRVRVHQGILGRRSQEAALVRVQGMTVRDSPVARRLGTEAVWVDTADVSGGSGGARLLIDAVAPVGRWRWWAPTLAGTAAPSDAELLRVAPVSLRRRLIAATIQSVASAVVIVAAVVIVVDVNERATVTWAIGGAVLASIVAVRFGRALLSYRHERWLIDERDLVFVNGALNRTRTLVPRRRAQSVTMSANWFQRRLGVRNVHVDTAAPSISGAARDLHAHDAETLTDAVLATVDETGGV